MAPVHGLLSAAVDTYAAHQALLGPLPGLHAEDLRRRIADSGLTGRGGAGFPAARKLAAVAERGGGVVVANGAEGEPASSKDRTLLMAAPHLVLDGLALAARAVGAKSAYLYAPDDVLAASIEPALKQRRDRIKVIPLASADTFISGQETAVVAAIHGLRAVPMQTPPPMYVKGVRGKPTLVQNVETLAQIALIARYGAGWFRDHGTADEPGSRLLTISGSVQAPDVYEVPGGTTLGDALSWAGGASEPLQAVLVGGYHGRWIPWTSATTGLALSKAALAPYDAGPGAGVIIALPQRRCGLEAAASIATYLAGQNAGQCGPCRNGLPTIADHLNDLARGRNAVKAHNEALRLIGSVDGRGACHHPGGSARMVRSALGTFRQEVELHVKGKCTGQHGPGRATA
ncbi:MAG: NADH-quinone oxidoreductase subunit 1 [Marmoricola sp.]|nr:NADH-quinone oxidoreductase subunit 1 [Marmoricola sp.]